jgi:hypothetical protein
LSNSENSVDIGTAVARRVILKFHEHNDENKKALAIMSRNDLCGLLTSDNNNKDNIKITTTRFMTT